MRQHARRPAAALLAATLAASSAAADEVVLRNGGRFQGVLLDDSPERVVLQSEGILWTFAREKVASTRREKPGRDAEERKARAYVDRMDRALRDANAFIPSRPSTMRLDKTPVVVIYGTDWCPACKAALDYVVARGYRHEFRDIEREPAANRERLVVARAAGVSMTSIPLVSIGRRAMTGFSRRFIDEARARR